MWFWTWFVLILASLAAAGWAAWHLWNKTKSVTRAIGALGALAASIPGRVSAQRATLTLTEPRAPDVFSDPHDPCGPRARVAERRVVRAQRAVARRTRHAARYEAWRRIDL